MTENKIRAKIDEAKAGQEASLEPSFRERHSCLIILILLVLIALYVFVSRDIFGVPFFLYVLWFGFDIVLLNMSVWLKAHASRAWPVAEAECLRAIASESLFRDNGRSSWHLLLEYRYAVKGEEYIGKKYALVGTDYRTKEEVDQVIAELGECFMVRYNPKQPAEAIVKVGMSYVCFIGVGVGLLVMGAGALGLLDYFSVLDVGAMIEQWQG